MGIWQKSTVLANVALAGTLAVSYIWLLCPLSYHIWGLASLEGIGQICQRRPRSKCSIMQHAPNCIGGEAHSAAAAYTMMVLFIRLSLLLEFIDLFHLEACFKACILRCIDSYFECTGWAVVVLCLPGFFGLLVCCFVRSFSDTYFYIHNGICSFSCGEPFITFWFRFCHKWELGVYVFISGLVLTAGLAPKFIGEICWWI